MKANRFIIVGLALSVLMSGLSLAWQAKNASENSPFAKLKKPLQISQLEYQMFRAEFSMLRRFIPFTKGIGPPTIIRFLSPDMKTLTIYVPVQSETMPSNLDERKKWLTEVADSVIGAAMKAIGEDDVKSYEARFLDYRKYSDEADKTSFDNLEASMPGVVAIYKNGKLTVR